MAVAGGDSSHLHEQQPQYQQPHQQQPSSLPITTNSLLELFIPGYTLISRVILDHAGLDLNRLVPILLLCFALIKSYDYIYSRAWRILLRFGTCSVSIDSNVDAYFSLTDWLADKGIGRTSTDIIALPLRRPNASQALGGGMYLDPYTSLLPAPGAPRRRKSQHYEPVLESFVRFSYRGRLFIWYRRRERRNLGESANMPTSLIEGRLFCFAWNTQPLQELVEEASEKYHQKRTTSTRIYRPAHKISRDGNGDLWQTAAMRPSRPLETVILDRKQKDSLTSDVQDYLRPTTRRWYAQRGIPYRRGYVCE